MRGLVDAVAPNGAQNWVPIRLPSAGVGERFPKFRQILIQNPSPTTGTAVYLYVRVDDDSDAYYTVFPGASIQMNVSEEEGIEIEMLMLKGSAAATPYEIVLMYPKRPDDESDATPP